MSKKNKKPAVVINWERLGPLLIGFAIGLIGAIIIKFVVFAK